MRVIERGNTLVPNVAFNSSLSLLNFGVEGNGQNTFTPGTIVVSCLSAAFAVICEILICTMKNCVHIYIHTTICHLYESINRALTCEWVVPWKRSYQLHTGLQEQVKRSTSAYFPATCQSCLCSTPSCRAAQLQKKRPQKSYRDRIKFSGSLTSRKPDFVCVLVYCKKIYCLF